MGERACQNLFLVGFSATGKSQVGREVARRLGWAFVDTDEEIVRLAGKPIPAIFAEDGEERFRRWEKEALERATALGSAVISTGGGAVLDGENRRLMAKRGLIICLEARPETIRRRLAGQTGAKEVRPLLAEAGESLERIRGLKESRQPFYAMADWTIHTDVLSPQEVAEEVIRAWNVLVPRLSRAAPDASAACVVRTATQSYPVYVGWGLLSGLGQRMRAIGLSGGATVISDKTVYAHYGPQVEEALAQGGFEAASYPVPAGEESKSMGVVQGIYDNLVSRRAERGHIIVALGGGMVGDLAGFVAATFLRGLPFVQVPTSLLAMVDASIGGKVAVNHPLGKNLIGAFYQPGLVLADVATLRTLPSRELTSGWAEAIKHALIFDPVLFEQMEQNAPALIRLEPEITARVVERSVVLKAKVVTRDEKEVGDRILLNFGHTIAHGLEAAADFQGFLHGEAVAIGMVGAMQISRRLGLLDEGVAERGKALLERFGLPTSSSGIDLEKVQGAMKLDKKVRGKAIRWVLLRGLGRTIINSEVPDSLVREVLEELVAG